MSISDLKRDPTFPVSIHPTEPRDLQNVDYIGDNGNIHCTNSLSIITRLNLTLSEVGLRDRTVTFQSVWIVENLVTWKYNTDLILLINHYENRKLCHIPSVLSLAAWNTTF